MVHKYMLQFERQTMKQGVLHCLYISNDVSYQLVLLMVYHQAVLHMLHDDCGHQGLDCTLTLARERSYWSTMYWDVAKDETNYHRCQVMKSHYMGPHIQQGSLVANNPLDLLCIDFTEINPSEDGKEDVLC